MNPLCLGTQNAITKWINEFLQLTNSYKSDNSIAENIL